MNGGWQFLESFLSFPSLGTFSVAYNAKNATRASLGKPRLKSCPSFGSFVPKTWKFGRIVGALCRINDNAIGHFNKLSGAIFVLNEFHSLGASTSLMARAVRRMHVRTGTKDAVLAFGFAKVSLRTGSIR